MVIPQKTRRETQSGIEFKIVGLQNITTHCNFVCGIRNPKRIDFVSVFEFRRVIIRTVFNSNPKLSIATIKILETKLLSLGSLHKSKLDTIIMPFNAFKNTQSINKSKNEKKIN